MKEISLIDISHRGTSREEQKRLQHKKQLPAVSNAMSVPNADLVENQTGVRMVRQEDISMDTRQVFAEKKGLRIKRDSRKTSVKKKIRRGGIASVAGLSILLAGLFHSPADLMQQQTINQLDGGPAVEIMLEEDDLGNEEDSKRKMESEPVRKGIFHRLADAIRSFFLHLPWSVRICVCIPLWGIGYGVLHLLSLFFPAAIMPALRHVISWILMAAILLGVFVLTMKCLFPHMPLKKILRKRNILLILAASLLLKAADLFVPLFWPGYERVKFPVMLILGSALLILIFLAIRRRRKSRRRTAA